MNKMFLPIKVGNHFGWEATDSLGRRSRQYSAIAHIDIIQRTSEILTSISGTTKLNNSVLKARSLCVAETYRHHSSQKHPSGLNTSRESPRAARISGARTATDPMRADVEMVKPSTRTRVIVCLRLDACLKTYRHPEIGSSVGECQTQHLATVFRM